MLPGSKKKKNKEPKKIASNRDLAPAGMMSFGKWELAGSVNGGATGTLFWLQGVRARLGEGGGGGWRLPRARGSQVPTQPSRGQAAGVHEAMLFQNRIICIETPQTQFLF